MFSFYNNSVVNINYLATKASIAANRLRLLSTDAKNLILEKIAERLEEEIPRILKANAKDINAGKRNKLSASLLDRILLTKDRIKTIAADIRNVMKLKDYAGEVMESRQMSNGLFIKRVRVPIGVIAIIYEARPNVTVDAAVLCLKSGNAVILKGGSDAMHSNRVIVNIIQTVLREMSYLAPQTRLFEAVQLLDAVDRNTIKKMLQLYNTIDVVIPRGSANLIKFVRDNSKIPVIETGASVVHTYVHDDANLEKAVKIALNAKLRRVSICNTLDSLLLHRDIARDFLTKFISALPKNIYHADRLEIRADSKSFELLRTMSRPKDFILTVKKAKEGDFDIEFLDYILAIKIVDSLEEAIEHISRHSLKHSEAIITENRAIAERFLNAVDSACVYWNASTQFSDGAQFGLGAEMGISTQKLHSRGPFALEGLTTYKWVIEGNGQIRPQ